jgi:AmmeMemoRadiSam system protein B
MRPKLRSLEIRPVGGEAVGEENGDEYWMLRDREGLCDTRYLPIEFGPLLSLLDGTRDAPEIARDYSRRYSEDLPEQVVHDLIEQLDEALLLDSPRWVQHRRDLMAQWNDSPVRPAAFAGLSYPDDPDTLREFFNGLFEQARALEKEPPASTLSQPATPCAPESIRGVVVPHIDFGRGGPVEALAYRALLRAHRAAPFDVFVVLGIAHAGVAYPFCATSKDFQTPLGLCTTDHDFLSALQSRVGPKLKSEQWAHKAEHSIEFVAAFLQHLEPLAKIPIVPILCGGFFEEIRSGHSPNNSPRIESFIKALQSTAREYEAAGKRVGFIASVDGAHVGSPFGHTFKVSEQVLADVQREDLEFWKAVEAGDAESMHAHIARDDNARNVDAHPALYTLLTAFPNLRGVLLRYDRAFHPERNELVSFATLALCEEN